MSLLFAIFFASINMSWADGYSTPAVYTVPASNEKPAMDYTDFSVDVIVEGSSIKVRYALPLALVGARQAFELNGEVASDGTAILTGKSEDMACDLEARTCNVRYQFVNVDLDKVRSHLESQGISGQSMTPFLAASRRFGGDPIGVIRF